jgi:hypothetical protein
MMEHGAVAKGTRECRNDLMRRDGIVANRKLFE